MGSMERFDFCNVTSFFLFFFIQIYKWQVKNGRWDIWDGSSVFTSCPQRSQMQEWKNERWRWMSVQQLG